MEMLRIVVPLSGLSLIALAVAFADDPETPIARRPILQVINGSKQPIEVFWLKSEEERIPNGHAASGKDLVITTTLGHRFAIVGQDDHAEVTVTSTVPVQAVRFDPPDGDGVPKFYTQRVSANGFPIVASAQVSPFALKEAAYLVDLMLAKRPDVRAAMINSGARLCILAHNEYTTDQPEFARLANEPLRQFPGISGKDYWDARARGMGGSERDPFCSCAEENLLGYAGDPYSKECILIHELAHNIHLRGMMNVDPQFDTRLKAAFDAAMADGLWKGKYASVNRHEYFAEGVQSWFDNNRENDHDHNHVDTREELIDYDPRLAEICREVFGDTEIRYTKPVTRLDGHLKGYDPSTAPKFEWPERLSEAKKEIRRAAEERNKKAASSENDTSSNLVSELHAALKQANPEYDSEGKFFVEDGKLVRIVLSRCKTIHDLSPLAEFDLSKVTFVDLYNATNISEISPLKSCQLTRFNIERSTKITDLSALKGMPLKWFRLYACPGIVDLTPLKGMSLTHFDIGLNPNVRDISVLKGMPIDDLRIDNCPQINDISVLSEMPLTFLSCHGCRGVKDFSPIRDLDLETLYFEPGLLSRDEIAMVKAMNSLKKLATDWKQYKKELSPADFWRRYDAGEFRSPPGQSE